MRLESFPPLTAVRGVDLAVRGMCDNKESLERWAVNSNEKPWSGVHNKEMLTIPVERCTIFGGIGHLAVKEERTAEGSSFVTSGGHNQVRGCLVLPL